MNMESVSETRDPAMRKTAGFLGAGLLLLALGWAVQPVERRRRTHGIRRGLTSMVPPGRRLTSGGDSSGDVSYAGTTGSRSFSDIFLQPTQSLDDSDPGNTPGAYHEEGKAARMKREAPVCDFKLKDYQCSYEAYLDANPAMKQWADQNPEMAAKERLRLQSVD